MRIKKTLLSVLATGMMTGIISCSNELTQQNVVQDGEEVEVNFEITIPQEYGTRATTTADLGQYRLVYRVYDKDGNELEGYPLCEPTQKFRTDGKYNNTSGSLVGNDANHLRFIKGQTYQIAFWAQYSDQTASNNYVNGVKEPFYNKAFDYSDLRAVKINYAEIVNNDKITIGTNATNGTVREIYDAFYASEKFTVSAASQTINVTLHRPFAQVNVGVTEEEWKRASEIGYNIVSSKAVLPAYNTLNVLDGSVSGFEKVTYDLAEIPSLTNGVENDKKLSVTTYTVPSGASEPTATTTDYYYISKNYILAPSARTTDAMEFTFHAGNSSYEDLVMTQGLTAAPYQRNFRTNILLNNYFTGTVGFSINIDPMYVGDFNNTNGGTSFGNQVAEGVGYDAETKTIYLTDKAGITWFRSRLNEATPTATNAAYSNNGTFEGMTVVLTTDVDFVNTNGSASSFIPLGDPLATPAATREIVFKGTFDGGNHTISNITYTRNFNVTYPEKDVLAGFFGITDGATIKNLKIQNATFTSQQKAGALVAYAKNTNIENCLVDNVTIKSNPRKDSNDNLYYDGNHAGGLVGYYEAGEQDVNLKSCYVKNATVTAFSNVGGLVGTISGAHSLVSGNYIDNIAVVANQFIGAYNKAQDANANKIYGGVENGAVGNANGSTVNSKTNNVLNNVTVSILAPDANGNYNINAKNDLTSLPNLVNGGENGLQTVTMTSDVTSTSRKASYGVTGIAIEGITFEGNNNTLTITEASTTWDHAIEARGGTIQNLTITGAFRGIFMPGASSDLIVNNVTMKGTRFTFSSDAGNKDYGVYFTDSKLYGWTSYTSAHKEVKFTDCTFGKGEGWAQKDNGIDYAFCRPYTETWFKNCDFEEGFELDTNQAIVHLVNCRLNGVTITAKNITDLCPSETKQGGILAGYNMYKSANVKFTE